MQEEVGILFHQLLLFGTFIIVGYLARACRLITDEMVTGLAQIVAKVLLPLMILTTLGSNTGGLVALSHMLPFLAGTLIMYGVLFGLGLVTAKLMRLPQPTRNVHTISMGFTNSGFMGLPLLLSIFPQEAVIAFVPFSFLETILLWGFCQPLTQPVHTGKKEPFRIKRLLTTVNLSLVLGLILMISGLNPSGAIWEGLTALGGTCKYMALLYVGGIIGVRGIPALLKRKQAFVMIPLKLILAPLLVFFIVGSLGLLSPTYLMILTIYTSLPCMVMVAILVENNGSDGEYAISAVLGTTIFSLGTMPLVMWFLSTYFL